MTKLIDRYRPHSRVQLSFPKPSRTQQNMRDECNINLIMKKYEKSKVLDHLNEHQGDYGDYINYDDYHTSMNRVLEARDTFMTIPASIRSEFQNDPSVFLQFAQDPKNVDRMVELGLARATPQDPAKASPEKKAATPPSSQEDPSPPPKMESDPS